MMLPIQRMMPIGRLRKNYLHITTASSAVIDYFKVVNGSLEYTAAPAAYKDTVATTSVVYDYYKNIQSSYKR